MTINIKNSHIHIHLETNDKNNETSGYVTEVDNLSMTGNFARSEKKFYSFAEAPDGIYVGTRQGNCWEEKYMSECEEDPVGIVIVKGEHRFVVCKNSLKETVELLEDDKMSSLKIYCNYRECVKDFDGYENTQILLSFGSKAAKYCKELGEKWYIPSAGEIVVMDEYDDELNRLLLLIGGTSLSNCWHWSSTRCSEKGYFVLVWGNGLRNVNYQNDYCWVRPVSASL